MIVWIHGPSGSGKSAVGALLAATMDVPFVDLDRLVEEREGRSILDIFSEVSESGFRAMEWNALVSLLEPRQSGLVVALGGGAVTEGGVRRICRSTGLRVFLDVSEEAAMARLTESSEARPLLFEEDPASAWRRLYQRRLSWYRDADIRIDSDGPLEDVVARTLKGVRALMNPLWCLAIEHDDSDQCAIEGYQSPFVAMRGARSRLADRTHAIVTDTGVLEAYSDLIVRDSSDESEILLTLNQGEDSKRLASVEEFVSVLVERGMGKDGAIVAIGGGVVTDLAGFLGSIYMRGVATVYIPTTLAGQVDAAIGGKTAVNSSGVRNLLGTIRHPDRVYIASGFLHSLPARELRGGFVEAMKMGIANSRELGDLCCTARSAVVRGEIPDSIDDIIRLSVSTKLDVVRQDLDDQSQRISLNLGHTFGHAIEAALPGELSHGEGVALGIIAASEVAQTRSIISARRRDQLHELFLPFAPADPVDVSIPRVIQTMMSDKKSRNGVLRLVLPTEETGYEVVSAPDSNEVTDALQRALSAVRNYHTNVP